MDSLNNSKEKIWTNKDLIKFETNLEREIENSKMQQESKEKTQTN
jgi:tetraacyldisaccharide-1-P 4'-kinase